MKEDNENNAIVACRFLLDIIKSWHGHLKIEENFGKLFEFLEEHDIFIPTKTHGPMTVEEIAR